MYFSTTVRFRVLGLILILLSTISYFSFNASVRSVLFSDPTLPGSTRDVHLILVSAFFPLAKSKHPLSDYDAWLSRFLNSVNVHIYFFTSPDMAETIMRLRGVRPITLNTSFASPFAIPPLVGLEDMYQEMHELDPEKVIHSPELYAVWSSKTFFLNEAVTNLAKVGINYDYAFWNDAGSFRDDQSFSWWPDSRRISEIWNEGSLITGTPKDDLLFIPIWNGPGNFLKDWQPSMGPLEEGDSFSEGSFFGGSPKAIAWWKQTFFAYHDYFIFQRHVFAGKDQTLYNSLFLLFPKRFITVWQYDSEAPNYIGLPEGPLGQCGGTWWYYQFFVASPDERRNQIDIWTPPKQDSLDDHKKCRLSRVLSMESVLKRRFGRGWTPPKATIDTSVSQRLWRPDNARTIG